MKLNKASAFAFFVAINGATASCAWAAATQWTVASGGNGHFYEPFIVASGVTWNDAQTAAQSKGGYLATLTSAAENNFVFSLVDNANYWTTAGVNSAGPWLGGFQPPSSAEPVGEWQWLNQEGLFAYSNWAFGEPNDSLVEDHLNFWAFGLNARTDKWNDIGGEFPNRAYIVEYVVPEPSSVVLLLFGLTYAYSIKRTKAGATGKSRLV